MEVLRKWHLSGDFWYFKIYSKSILSVWNKKIFEEYQKLQKLHFWTMKKHFWKKCILTYRRFNGLLCIFWHKEQFTELKYIIFKILSQRKYCSRQVVQNQPNTTLKCPWVWPLFHHFDENKYYAGPFRKLNSLLKLTHQINDRGK